MLSTVGLGLYRTPPSCDLSNINSRKSSVIPNATARNNGLIRVGFRGWFGSTECGSEIGGCISIFRSRFKRVISQPEIAVRLRRYPRFPRTNSRPRPGSSPLRFGFRLTKRCPTHGKTRHKSVCHRSVLRVQSWLLDSWVARLEICEEVNVRAKLVLALTLVHHRCSNVGQCRDEVGCS